MNEEQQALCANFISNFADQVRARGELTEAQAERIVTLATGTLLGTIFAPVEPTEELGEFCAHAIKASVYCAYHPGRKFVLQHERTH